MSYGRCKMCKNHLHATLEHPVVELRIWIRFFSFFFFSFSQIFDFFLLRRRESPADSIRKWLPTRLFLAYNARLQQNPPGMKCRRLKSANSKVWLIFFRYFNAVFSVLPFRVDSLHYLRDTIVLELIFWKNLPHITPPKRRNCEERRKRKKRKSKENVS